MEDITPEHLLQYWFGTEADDGVVAQQQASFWWKKCATTDNEIRARFEPLVSKAAAGELDAWRTSASGRLALIILMDQFPRSIYRNTPKAFQFDRIALQICQEGLANGDDQQLRPVQRVFFYMPLEHSENIEHQNLSVKLFEKLSRDIHPEVKEAFSGFFDYAVRHRDVIERFGRFPHRNKILGRQSTDGEALFLSQPNSSF